MSIDNPEIVGFDLGHGESALQHTRLMAIGEPKPLEVNSASTIITMVGRTSDDMILIGREVIERRSDGKVVESHLRFKHPDLDRHPFAGRATRLFVRGVVEALRQLKMFADLNKVIFFVGCPSGWKPAVQNENKALLEEAGHRNILLPLRWVISIEQIDDKLSEASRDIATELNNKMMETDKVAKKGESLPEKIAAEMEADLRQRADDQVLRF